MKQRQSRTFFASMAVAVSLSGVSLTLIFIAKNETLIELFAGTWISNTLMQMLRALGVTVGVSSRSDFDGERFAKAT
ncbi:hypothetical protein ET33_27585 [Paenibacillus tyrfis]|uniref:Uncharacterized protein n=1 Tax=Paenibacillus tyrfis TaxID=1501230 RepID=A0A081NUK2_9BACL|nr:hypothetical protein ET33_27585 [Paenibacillus tyrfis]